MKNGKMPLRELVNEPTFWLAVLIIVFSVLFLLVFITVAIIPRKPIEAKASFNVEQSYRESSCTRPVA